ncbi:uncharacterized protein LOC132951228 isoform X1 [Metopolophium dirhodum]|uniref:uncharacterized protein LOC132939867 isoform X1 n=1 Tax=Metopolophium dirhodum TaxID=44670 RepID=UPI00298FAB9C|nr:uncharacterized protein LOC132939867 isoform X1 [Metopolophium dirhodum]XP_060878992.1 uncharacterized protein LOC132951228 isoform X1 [Metopolophium dirhodum]
MKADELSFSERPRKIIRQEVEKDVNILNTFTDRDMIRIGKNINRAKLQRLPKLPKCMDDVHDYLDMDEVICTKRENLVIFNDKSCNIIIFSCESNLKFMCSVETILVDATFNYCTKLFQQMFTVIGFKNNKYVPVALSLLKDKKDLSYTTVMSTLKSKCLEINLIFKPQHIVSDFEKGILQAPRKEFPDTTLIGCRFHLSQA